MVRGITMQNINIKPIVNELKDMKNDESGQGAAEYILLFGGVIVIAIAAMLIYNNYFKSQPNLNASSDVNTVRQSINASA